MPYLSKDAILGAQDRKYEDVQIPEWGGMVRIASLTAAQRDRYEIRFAAAQAGQENWISLRALLVAACAVDELGSPLFSAQDVEALGEKSAAALQRLWERCLDLNVLTKASAERIEGN